MTQTTIARFDRGAACLATLLLLGACASAPTPTPPPGAAPATPSTAVATPATTSTLPTAAELRAIFARQAADRAQMERLVSARYPQLSGRKRELMVEHSAAMFTAPGFAERVHALMAPKVQGRTAMAAGAQVAFQAELRDQAAALGQQLTLKGMTRLPAEDQERFVRHAIALHRGVDAGTCRAMIEGRLPAARLQEIELGHTARQSDADFEQALAMGRRAMQAELADAPAVPELTPDQTQAAQRAWGQAILARAEPAAAKARFDRVRADPAAASDADTCWTTLQYMEAMLDLRGKERVWQLQSYMRDTADSN